MPLTPQSAPAPAGALADDVGRLALELSARLDDLDNERLHTLAWFLREECRRRGIT